MPRPLRLLTFLLTLLVLPLAGVRLAQAADTKAALAYVPADAVGVMTIDVDGLRTTPYFQKVVAKLVDADPHVRKKLGELKQHTGFDLIQHVHGVVLAAGPAFPGDDDDFVLIAEAKIDEARLIAFMQKEGAKLAVKNDASGKHYAFDNGKGAIAFRGKHVIVGGTAIFKRALEKKGPSPKLAAALTPHLSKHVAFVFQPNAATRAELRKEMPDFEQLELLSGGALLKNGFTLNAVATFTTAAPPAKIAKEANEGLAQVRQDKQAKQMGLDTLISRVKVSAVRTDLRVDVSLTQADLDKLEKLLDQLM